MNDETIKTMLADIEIIRRGVKRMAWQGFVSGLVAGLILSSFVADVRDRIQQHTATTEDRIP